jgi:mycothiol synthase
MYIRELCSADNDAIKSICRQELTLDRYPESIPDILNRRPDCISLAAISGEQIVGAVYGHTRQRKQGLAGIIDLITVRKEFQRQGVSRMLFEAIETKFRELQCCESRIEGDGPFYAWPGIDLRYTPALCAAQRLGYATGQTSVSMEVDLRTTPLDVTTKSEKLRRAGIEIRRADPVNDQELIPWISEQWNADWAEEVSAGMKRDPSGCHVALAEKKYLAFCAHGTNRVGDVGPMATAKEARGQGIGTALMACCLADKVKAGMSTADLIWVGPVALAMHSKHFSAKVTRAFWAYEKSLTSQ